MKKIKVRNPLNCEYKPSIFDFIKIKSFIFVLNANYNISLLFNFKSNKKLRILTTEEDNVNRLAFDRKKNLIGFGC